jgi:hypothetical protein
MPDSATAREPLLARTDFPPGTPASVISIAMSFEAQVERKIEPTERSLIRRLAVDPRISGIWRELSRRRRVGPREYLYPAVREYLCGYDPAIRTAPRESLQDWALGLVFSAAVVSFFVAPAITKAELEERVRPYRELAVEAVKMRRQFAKFVGKMTVELTELDNQIAWCREQARRLRAGRVVIDRNRGDARIKGYLGNLSAEMLGLFGTAPRRALATIASVALDRQVTPAMAREAIRRAVKEAEGEGLTTSC